MALNFPDNPTTGDQYTAEGVTFQFYDNRWVLSSSDGTGPVTIVEADTSAGWQVWGDTLIQWGFVVTNAGGNATAAFPQAFKTTPTVTLAPDSSTSFLLTAQTTQVTTGAVNVAVSNGGTFGAFTVRWIAVGEAPDNLKQPKEVGVVGQAGGAFEFPVGYVYISTTQVDPAVIFKYGVWAEVAQGRVLVGVGDNTESTWTAGEERGSETHTLTAGEMPSHTHNVDPPSTNTNTTGAHTHNVTYQGAVNAQPATGTQTAAIAASQTATTTSNGSHSHSVNIAAFNSGSAGSGNAHNNVQPSLAVYMYERVS